MKAHQFLAGYMLCFPIQPDHAPEGSINPVVHDEDLVGLPCYEIDPKFKDYVVPTKFGVINRLIQDAREHDEPTCKTMLLVSMKHLFQYATDQLDEHHAANDTEFANWRSHVVIFFVYRKMVLGRPIPLVKL